MTLPPFVYSLAFWKAFAVIAATIFYAGGVADPELIAKILGAVLGVLYLIGVTPELKAKGLIADKK